LTGPRKPRSRLAKGAAYHHGDLRRGLLEEALKLLRETGPDGLSLRELARRLGVTYGAPHHHFAEKDDLFAAIAEEAFGELIARVQARVMQPGERTPGERLTMGARMYLDFARAERVRYQVMFLPQLRDRKRFASLHATGGQALRLLALAFEAASVPSEQSHARAVACWSTLHGFASLVNEGFLEERGEALESLARSVVDQAVKLPERAR
jgi:AcrR family transcriptional regulator